MTDDNITSFRNIKQDALREKLDEAVRDAIFAIVGDEPTDDVATLVIAVGNKRIAFCQRTRTDCERVMRRNH